MNLAGSSRILVDGLIRVLFSSRFSTKHSEMYSEYKRQLASSKQPPASFREFLFQVFGAVSSPSEGKIHPVQSSNIALMAQGDDDALSRKFSRRCSYPSFIVLSGRKEGDKDSEEDLDWGEGVEDDQNQDTIKKADKNPSRSISSSESSEGDHFEEIRQELARLQLQESFYQPGSARFWDYGKGVDDETSSDINFYFSDNSEDNQDVPFALLHQHRRSTISSLGLEALFNPRLADFDAVQVDTTTPLGESVSKPIVDKLSFYRNFSALSRPSREGRDAPNGTVTPSQASVRKKLDRRLTRSVPARINHLGSSRRLAPFVDGRKTGVSSTEAGTLMAVLPPPRRYSKSRKWAGFFRNPPWRNKRRKNEVEDIAPENVPADKVEISNRLNYSSSRGNLATANVPSGRPSMSLYLDTVNEVKSSTEEELLQSIYGPQPVNSTKYTLALIYHHPILYNF